MIEAQEIDLPEGFRERHTGGGCMAWELKHDHEMTFEIWITDLDGCSMPDTSTEYVIVGFHLHDDELTFEDGKPWTIPQLEALINPFDDSKFDVNENYFSYGIDLKKDSDLQTLCSIVKDIPNTTFNKEVVLGLNTPKGDETQ